MGAPPDYTELPTSPKWRLISDAPPPLGVGVLVSDGKDVTAGRWITESVVTPHCVDCCYEEELSFRPIWWMPLPDLPGKDTA